MRLTSEPQTIDPLTGIPIVLGQIRTTQAGDVRVPQVTGAAPGSRNTRPGTDPDAPGNDDPGLPYGFTEVPRTGPLT